MLFNQIQKIIMFRKVTKIQGVYSTNSDIPKKRITRYYFIGILLFESSMENVKDLAIP